MISNVEKYLTALGGNRDTAMASLEADALRLAIDVEECARVRLVARDGAKSWLEENKNGVDHVFR